MVKGEGRTPTQNYGQNYSRKDSSGRKICASIPNSKFSFKNCEQALTPFWELILFVAYLIKITLKTDSMVSKTWILICFSITSKIFIFAPPPLSKSFRHTLLQKRTNWKFSNILSWASSAFDFFCCFFFNEIPSATDWGGQKCVFWYLTKKCRQILNFEFIFQSH